MDKLYIIIPAYNEEENIEKVINDWYKIINKLNDASRLVIIDDGSKDKTYEIIKKISKKNPKLVALTKENSGHGSTILYGYNYALKNKCDYIFQTDSDGQTVANEFWTFWNERKKYDMIIGNRKNRQDGISRIFVTKVLKIVIFIKFHVWLKDANTPFRLIKSNSLKKTIKLIPKDFNLSNVILSVIFKKSRLKIIYKDITFKPRQGGINSINFKKIAKIGYKALKDFSIINRNIDKELKKNYETKK